VTTTRQSGFTLIELMIVMAISAPVMFAVLSATERVGGAVSTVSRNAEVAGAVQRAAERIGKLVRSAHRTTFQTRATAADVAALRAAAVGNWFNVLANDPRGNVRFQCAEGVRNLNAEALTSARELEIELEDGESDNGVDDDGDGLVDESTLMLRHGSARVSIASGVEEIAFELDGRAFRMTMRCGKSDQRGGVNRVTQQYVWWVRNP
jgi:prepilin-type N-terminal cleavage/methylation domain-containing protein